MGHETDLGMAGGRVVGAFAYTSAGALGWTVSGRRDFGGLTADAVQAARGLVERLPWWSDPDLPVHRGRDVYERPRRLAWLRQGQTPQRFLIHTIHADTDASGRPGNNYSECLVVGRDAPHAGAAESQSPRRDKGARRPSALWDPSLWCTPWGAEEVARSEPGRRWHRPSPTPLEVVFDQVAGDPVHLAQLHLLYREVHRVLHLRGRSLVAAVDEFIFAAGMLDAALSMLPAEDMWIATFDIRSIAPVGAFGAHAVPVADINLFGPEYPGSRQPGTIDLTHEAVERRGAPEPQSAAQEPCPVCHRWFASIDSMLAEPGVTWAAIQGRVASLQPGHSRRREVMEASAEAPMGSSEGFPDATSWLPVGAHPVSESPGEPDDAVGGGRGAGAHPMVTPGGAPLGQSLPSAGPVEPFMGGGPLYQPQARATRPAGAPGPSTTPLGQPWPPRRHPEERVDAGPPAWGGTGSGTGVVSRTGDGRGPSGVPVEWVHRSLGPGGTMDTDRDLAAMQWVSELIFKTYIKVRDQDLYPDVRERVVSELWRDVLQLAKIEAQKFEPPQQGGALHPGEHPALPATSPATAPPPIAPPPIAPPPGAQPETAPGGRRAKRRNKDRGN